MMAMEALKSAGIQAYQGSSRKTAVKAAPKASAPEAPVVARDSKIVEKAIQTGEGKAAKDAEPKMEAKAAPIMTDNGAVNRKQLHCTRAFSSSRDSSVSKWLA